MESNRTIITCREKSSNKIDRAGAKILNSILLTNALRLDVICDVP